MNLLKSIMQRFLRIIIIPKEKITYVISGFFGGEKDVKLISQKGTVLIGALKNPKQLSYCIKNNFYHIPKAVAGDMAEKAEYVAIYQSRNFFNRMSGITYYGKIKKLTYLPRYKIREIPKKSREMYYRFDVEKWQMLDRKIEAKDSGIICEYTTIDKLKNAKDVPELFKSN